jgi:hypothetical protein
MSLWLGGEYRSVPMDVVYYVNRFGSFDMGYGVAQAGSDYVDSVLRVDAALASGCVLIEEEWDA